MKNLSCSMKRSSIRSKRKGAPVNRNSTSRANKETSAAAPASGKKEVVLDEVKENYIP